MSLLNTVANLADRYTLAWLLGPAAVGLYLAPFAIANRAMALVANPLTDLFRPLLFDAENRADDAQARRVLTAWLAASVVIGLIALAGIAVFGRFIADWVLAREYRDGAVAIMLWISLAYAIHGITQVLENRILSLSRSAHLLLPMTLGAAANLLFSILLVPWAGVIGAAQANCASFIVRALCTAALLYYARRRRIGTGPSRGSGQ
jgi:O-antigen/teichoic acid export membrane protein